MWPLLILATWFTATAAAAEPRVTGGAAVLRVTGDAAILRVTGDAVTAFDWRTERCATWDAPDGPARAWRGPSGEVRLLISSTASRASAGPDLDRLAHACPVLAEGAHRDDPGAHDDRVWIAAPHVGGRVVALAHTEFHGHLRPGLCAAGTYAACWRNSVVELGSSDGGLSFRRAGVVAALPYPFDGGQTRRSGYFNPSNVVTRDGHLYAFVFAEATGAQRRGACLIRRPVWGGPSDWRTWDGAGFGARFADAYAGPVTEPAAHVCAPLPGLSSTISSLVWSGQAGRWLAVTPATLRGEDGATRSGIWWTASDDLIRWDRPRLLVELPLLWRRDCAAAAAWAYPSLIDPDSLSPSFETVDGAFRLYLVRMALGPDCRVGPQRDLVWMPVSWPRP
jgi:hypothetical protein